MRVSYLSHCLVAGVVVSLFGVLKVLAADPPGIPNTQNPDLQAVPQQQSTLHARTEAGDRALVIRSLPSKKLVGSNVQNAKGETLGSVDDLVIDLESGKVAYAALSVGGVLGIGEKLFAVPFEELKTTHDTSNNITFVLDVSKERLENSPGFDKNHWPDFASPQWRNQIDTYYRQSSASRPANERNSTENR
jgi:sporulation protein YlmC with PRC-barrel domain